MSKWSRADCSMGEVGSNDRRLPPYASSRIFQRISLLENALQEQSAKMQLMQERQYELHRSYQKSTLALEQRIVGLEKLILQLTNGVIQNENFSGWQQSSMPLPGVYAEQTALDLRAKEVSMPDSKLDGNEEIVCLQQYELDDIFAVQRNALQNVVREELQTHTGIDKQEADYCDENLGPDETELTPKEEGIDEIAEEELVDSSCYSLIPDNIKVIEYPDTHLTLMEALRQTDSANATTLCCADVEDDVDIHNGFDKSIELKYGESILDSNDAFYEKNEVHGRQILENEGDYNYGGIQDTSDIDSNASTIIVSRDNEPITTFDDDIALSETLINIRDVYEDIDNVTIHEDKPIIDAHPNSESDENAGLQQAVEDAMADFKNAFEIREILTVNKKELESVVENEAISDTCALETYDQPLGDDVSEIMKNLYKDISPNTQDQRAIKIGTKWKCTFQGCSKQFSRKKYVYEHHKCHSTKHTCQICSSRYLSTRRYLDHVQLVHGAVIGIMCNKTGCDALFETEDLMKIHYRDHHSDSEFTCPLCPTKFTTKASLVNHLKIKHAETKENASPGKGIASKRQRQEEEGCAQKRMKTVAPAKSTESARLQPFDWTRKERSVMVSCKFPNCRRSYSCRRALWRHYERVHATIMRSCPLCRQEFRSQRALDHHLKIQHKQD